MSVVGREVPHESAIQHVTGIAQYTDDLQHRFPRLLHAWPVMAPHSHAKILSVDLSPSLAVEGVVTVLGSEDAPGEADVGAARHDEPIFPEIVTYHGHPVAWVLADNIEAAKLGALAAKVEYEALSPILSIQDAIDADSFHTETQRIADGDVDQALAEAPHRLSAEFHIGGQEHFYLETHAAIVDLAEDGQVVIHSSTQHPSETQEIVARVLKLPRSAVTCQSLRMGGAFGGKEVQANLWAAIAAIGALKTGRPVRVRLDRLSDFVMTGKRHPYLARYEVGFDDSGKVLALKADLFSDGGWSLDLSDPVMSRALFHIDNAYRIPNLTVTGRVAKTHKTSQTAFRGFGGPQGMVVVEDAMERVARHLGLEAHTVREKAFYAEGDRTHYGQPVRDAARMQRIWNELKKEASFDERLKEVRAYNDEHPHRKRGIAITPVKFGISFTTAFFNQAGALVLIYQDGSIQLNHGGTEMGQGLHTKMMQIAAQTLGVELSRIRMMPTRTDKVPNTSATAASSGTDLNGAAVKNACETLRTRLYEVAARHFACDPEDIEGEEGEVWHYLHPDKRLRFGALARQAYLQRVSLFAAGHYKTPRISFNRDTGKGKPFHYFAYGAAISEVEVDGFTGQYVLRRVDILHDVGDSISPIVDVGQVEGGFVQGLGWLTQEELVWHPETGRLMTAGASTYKLPSLGECPQEFHVRLLPKATESKVVHGSKAVGEPPFMLAMSAREALRDAAAAFGTGGVLELGLPATPEAVFWALSHAKASSEDTC